MEIDWVTVGAQIVNFLILVYLLKRFLYQPIITAMAKREQRIASRLNSAAEREHHAQQQQQQYAQQRQALEQRRQTLLQQAKDEATAHYEQLLHQARQEVAQQRQRWVAQLKQEQGEFLRALQDEVADSIEKIGRRALADLADAELEGQVIRKFSAQLENIERTEREKLAAASGPLWITTAFKLAPDQQQQITHVLRAVLARDVTVQFNRSEHILCGIELTTGEHRLGWTLQDYLDDLNRTIAVSLEKTQTALP